MTAALRGDASGTVAVEYVIVLALLVAVASLAVIALGPPLLELFRSQQALLLSPFP
jgi:Flp pilus assembly pilin Flp